MHQGSSRGLLFALAFLASDTFVAAVYRANQLADERDELFLSYLSPPHRRGP